MNLKRTVLALPVAAALLLGGLPASFAAPIPSPAIGAGAEPAPAGTGRAPSASSAEPAPELSGGVATLIPAEARASAGQRALDPGLARAAAAGALPTTTEDIAEAFGIVNDHRRQGNRAPLAYNTELSRTAQRWADAMAATRTEVENPDPFAGVPAGAVRMDQYFGKGRFTGAFQGPDAVEALTHYLLDFYPRNGTDQFARDLTHLGIGVSHVPTTTADGPGWETYLTIYFYAYPAGQAVPGTSASPTDATIPTSPTAPAAPTAPTTVPVKPAPYSVGGAIGHKWARLGGATVFGLPIMNEKGGLAEGGVYQEFRRADGRKTTFYWSPTHGAHTIHNTASIGKKWIAEGREHNYGLPTIDERSLPGGAYQVFRRDGRGTKVLWSPSTGSHAIKEYGAIGRKWMAAGYERGYGYPVTDEYVHGSEIRQRFSNGYTVHYDSGRTWVTH